MSIGVVLAAGGVQVAHEALRGIDAELLSARDWKEVSAHLGEVMS